MFNSPENDRVCKFCTANMYNVGCNGCENGQCPYYKDIAPRFDRERYSVLKRNALEEEQQKAAQREHERKIANAAWEYARGRGIISFGGPTAATFSCAYGEFDCATIRNLAKKLDY